MKAPKPARYETTGELFKRWNRNGGFFPREFTYLVVVIHWPTVLPVLSGMIIRLAIGRSKLTISIYVKSEAPPATILVAR
jgi:hypothetical protein